MANDEPRTHRDEARHRAVHVVDGKANERAVAGGAGSFPYGKREWMRPDGGHTRLLTRQRP